MKVYVRVITLLLLLAMTFPVAAGTKSAAEHNAKGMDFVRAGELERAIDAFTEAVQVDPAYAKAYNNRGGAYAAMGKYEQALADCEQVLFLAPDYAKGYNNRAYIKAKLGSFDDAITDVETAMAIGPVEGMFYDTRGYAYAGKGLYDRALQDLNQALAIDATLRVAYFHRGEVYDRLGLSAEALKDYSAYIESAKQDRYDGDLVTAKKRYVVLSVAAATEKPVSINSEKNGVIHVEDGQAALQRGCLQATITAVRLEIDRHQRWIHFHQQQGDHSGTAQLEECLATLQKDLARYLVMDAADFILPDKVTAGAKVEGAAKPDAVLQVDGMGKNGPWYHIAGIAGDDYGKLLPNMHYDVSFYKVYPRSYWGMDSAYIYIAGTEGAVPAGAFNKGLRIETETTPAEGKRIRGEVFSAAVTWPFQDVIPCAAYKVYLLKDEKPGSKGDLILDAKEHGFDITISPEKLAKYSYIEFVSAEGSRTMNLDALKGDKLEIVLGREVMVKKPAIYLYPLRKSQIIVTHAFKGKIHSTYPRYEENWTVVAQPDGSLWSARDQRSYKYLFWDGIYAFGPEHYQFKAGFCVNKSDYVSFLQKKLTHIGLNESEMNDFIVYWLPAMNRYENCFIHFRINDNIDGTSVLTTQPTADTTIRVFMEFSGVENLDNIRELPEQRLPTFVRRGFTLVEWGGAEIGNTRIE